MEAWDIYDCNRVKTSRTMIRGNSINKGDYHLVVHVCIFNSKGEMLIQQRQSFKDGWSNMWDLTCGGSAVAGDTGTMAASRELFEEIGYSIDFSNIRPSFSINFDNGFDDYYLINKDVDINKLVLQYEEVQNVKWATKNEILEMIDNNVFIPYYKELIEMIFVMRNTIGVLKE